MFVFAPAIARAWLISSDFHHGDTSWPCEPSDCAVAHGVYFRQPACFFALGKLFWDSFVARLSY
jgi:hypothetical protein